MLAEVINDLNNNFPGWTKGGSNDRIYNEIPSGVINGVNVQFTTTHSFIPESVSLRVNGLQCKPIVDYYTIGANLIQMNYSLGLGEKMELDYTIKL